MKGFQKWYEYYKEAASGLGVLSGGAGPAPQWVAEDAGFYELFLEGQEAARSGSWVYEEQVLHPDSGYPLAFQLHLAKILGERVALKYFPASFLVERHALDDEEEDYFDVPTSELELELEYRNDPDLCGDHQ